MAELILFDLDGTLTDSAPGITRCVQYALNYLGKPQYTREELNCFLGPPLHAQFMKFAGLTSEEADVAVEQYRERYNGIGIYENEVYEGIPELLAFLKKQGKKLGIASSKPQIYVEEILGHFKLKHHFDVIVGSELDGSRTDKAEVIEEALRRSGYEKRREQVVMVGDRSHDVAGAKSCGLFCVGAAYGYGGRTELEEAGADLIAGQVSELGAFLAEKERNQKETPEENQSKKKTPKFLRYGQDLSWGKKIWDIVYPMVFFLLCMMVVTMIALIIASLTTGVQGFDYVQLVMRIPGLPLLISIGFYGATIVSQNKTYRLDQMRFGAYERKWDVGKVILACLLVVCVGHLWSTCIDLSGLEHVFPGYAKSAAGAFEGQNPILLIVATVLLGPVAEEMIFRGMIYRRAKNYLGLGWAVGLSSVLFGIYHGNTIQFLYATGLGILLAILHEASGSLLVPIIGHMAANLWAIYSNDCINDMTGLLPQAKIIVLGIEGILAVLSIFLLFRKGSEKKEQG